MMVNNILLTLENFFADQYILLGITSILMLLRVYLLFKFAIFSLTSVQTQKARFFLILFLASATFVDSAWILKGIRDMFFPYSDYRPYLCWLRLAWGMLVTQYQALALFLESLVSPFKTYSTRQKCFLFISSIFIMLAGAIAFLDFNCTKSEDRPTIEIFIRSIQTFYILLLLLPPSLIYAVWHLQNRTLPLILKKQLKIVLLFFMLPIFLCDLLQALPFLPLIGSMSKFFTIESYAVTGISQILKTITVYYCARKVMSLRFLNLKNHVQSLSQFHFVNSFRTILEQLGHATDIGELKHITQTFFKESFFIQPSEVALHVRQDCPADGESCFDIMNPAHRKTSLIETFIGSYHTQEPKILIYDEISFSDFYENDTNNRMLLNFLESIDADIFLPLYESGKMIAYITVKRHARNGHLYSDVDRDEMLIFSEYLGHVINLLKNRNLHTILHQEKILKDELYLKHQQINQYKESIRSFLRSQKQQTIGIIFYKHRQFVMGNKAAKDLIHININMQEGHPLSKTIRTIARQVEEYKEPQKCFAQDKDGNRLVISGVPNLERNNVIIMVYHPDISDVIKSQLEALHDPTEWDYLLYLETTKSGKLINQLIPSSSEKFLTFKIQLLKATLSKKALLLNVPEDDLALTVEILHHTSLRETLRIIELTEPVSNNETAITLFGINPIFNTDLTQKPLLEQLNGNGTLCIQNIHFLDLETQNKLAEFIKYGLYSRFKSDQVHSSDVRIICSSPQDLQQLVIQGEFSKALFNELQHTTLVMPSLMSLSEDELSQLVDGFTEQALETQDLKNILSLTETEKHKIAATRPVSLKAFKKYVQTVLTQKSKNKLVQEEARFDPAYQITTPQLAEAARLGKHALRDPRLLAMLWYKFKSQTKIATFLNVNRSTVNRRLKDSGLKK